MKCLLCEESAQPLWESYYHCPSCGLRFLDPVRRLTPDEERRRYEEHNNDISDVRYRAFVSPLFEEVKRNFSRGASGLDFGAGTGPVLATMLNEAGYPTAIYDPIFHPNPSALDACYDFIVACEVAEHFFQPGAEFHRLRSCLRPGGKLAMMTLLYDETIDFSNWYYRRDPTHVVFYMPKTFEYIAWRFKFASSQCFSNRLVVLSR